MSNINHEGAQLHQREPDVPNRGSGRILQRLWDKMHSPRTEPTKKALSRGWWVRIRWHFWTLTPCLITGVLLWLNLSNFSTGREIAIGRRNPEVTSFVLGVVAGCAKAHEIIMVVGLLNIARQAIQRGLTQGGTLLGLLGAEKSLSTVLFISSLEFRAAWKYGFSEGPRKLKIKIRKIVVVIVVVCCLCTVVGPATYVLMVPRLNWFDDKPLAWNHPNYTYGIYPRCCPYILINPSLVYSNLTDTTEDTRGDLYTFGTPEFPNYNYWQAVPTFDLRDGTPYTNNNTNPENRTMSHVHHYMNLGLPVTVNTTWSPGRSLDARERKAKNGTIFSTAWIFDIDLATYALKSLYQPAPKYALAPLRLIADMTGIWSETTCRRRISKTVPGSNSSFSFESVTSGSIGGSEVPSSRLILLYDKKNITYMGSHEADVNISKIWITEGWVEGDRSDFTNKLMVVLQDDNSTGTVIVCSNVVTLRSVKATSATTPFDANELDGSSGSLNYFPVGNPSSTTTERKLLYHKEWLDSINSVRPGNGQGDDDIRQYPNWTVPPAREPLEPTQNSALQLWAEWIAQLKWSNYSDPDPTLLELGVGGAFISVISRLYPSNTQYSPVIQDHYGDDGEFSNSFKSGGPPDALMAEPMIEFLGSLWQLRRGGTIIKAWGTVAEYGTLCLGTSPERAPLENACAGIKSGTTLQTLVGIREIDGAGAGSGVNLELTVLPPEPEAVEEQEKLPRPGSVYGAPPRVGNEGSIIGGKISGTVGVRSVSAPPGGATTLEE
ncbi:uncharacterized protein LAJ45_10095 [Morchella importuna]|uniref:uncharacterized protein n=1 Tax=Morchella importuna TaxID=1174673 RepID=UPI001E8EA4E2|nr:uncharacterized protein LAJ45_10095 [Morchella importuna]KAH8145953.1 hypothetical protein LAJ45_10095 [Morchella importuna]